MQNTCLRILASLVAALPMFGADPSQSARRIFDKQLTAAEGEVIVLGLRLRRGRQIPMEALWKPFGKICDTASECS